MAHHGDIRLGDTIDIKFTTVNTSGVPTQLAGTPAISAYPGNSTTQITAGITLTVDFDGVTGLNNVRVVATAANGYAAATNYSLVITTGTVGGSSVVGYEVGAFSVQNRSPAVPEVVKTVLYPKAAGNRVLIVHLQKLDGSPATGSLTNLAIEAQSDNQSVSTIFSGADIETPTTPGTYQAPTTSDNIRWAARDIDGDYEMHLHSNYRTVSSSAEVSIRITADGIKPFVLTLNVNVADATTLLSESTDTNTKVTSIKTTVDANLDADISTMSGVVSDISARIPSALVSGKMDARVQVINNTPLQGTGTAGDKMRPA